MSLAQATPGTNSVVQSEHALIAQLQGRDRNSMDVIVAGMNPINSQHRAAAMSIIEAYVRDYIQPALPYGQTDDEGDIYFDVDAALGEDIDGLALSLITPRFPDLSLPQDSAVKEAVEYLGFDDTTPEQRTAFAHSWIAQRANSCIRGLCLFLEPDAALTPALQNASQAHRPALLQEMRHECAHLDVLLQQPLSGGVKYYLDRLHRGLQAILESPGC